MAITRSDRINFIAQIAGRLASEDWAIIDLTLKTYNLPTSDEWTSDRSSYVITMAAKADDNTLLELAKHVGIETPEEQQHVVEPSFWAKSKLRMFISHLSDHRVQAANIQKALFNRGIGCFVAHNDIEPTTEWQTQIELALSTCDLLVALLQPNFHQSKWTDQEIGFAMGRGMPIFAVRLGEDPYGFIGRFQAFNGNGKSDEKIAEELFLACIKNKQTQKKIASSLISLFETSGSFAVSKDRVGYLEMLEYWEKEFSSRIEAALKANDQIAGSWGVKDRVEKLVAKHGGATSKTS